MGTGPFSVLASTGPSCLVHCLVNSGYSRALIEYIDKGMKGNTEMSKSLVLESNRLGFDLIFLSWETCETLKQVLSSV